MRNKSRRGILLAVMAFFGPTVAVAYDVTGGWPNGSIPMKLRLDSSSAAPAIPNGGLLDGGRSWDAAVLPTFTEWNVHLERAQISHVADGGTSGARNNGQNEMFFSPTIYGEPFNSGVLAVTVSRRGGAHGLRFIEADILFNTAAQWNSYRGDLRSSVDIRRVALHELGHVLGLDHPNQANPPQLVSAVMNSTISSVHQLQPDDTAGVQRVYSGGIRQPVVTAGPASVSAVEGGDGGALTLQVDGGAPPPESDILKYAWTFQPAGSVVPEFLFTVTEGQIALGSAQLDDAGSYRATVETPLGESSSALATVSVATAAKNKNTRLANLSTRGMAGDGDRPLIVGFAIEGSQSRRVLLRAAGPTLTSEFGVPGMIRDPILRLFEGQNRRATNDDWNIGGAGPQLREAFETLGAFELAYSEEAALIADLPPGAYTATVTSKFGPEGLALVEVYDLDGAEGSGSRLINLSTRAHVGTDDQVLIAGFVINGPAPRTYLLRGVGDALEAFGVPDHLDDPTLQLFSGSNALLRKTDDWDSPAFLQEKLRSAFGPAGAIDLVDRQESAMLLTLSPGAYTLQLAGFARSTGIALVEIYEMPPE